ncbi:MAG: carboxypeptidase regulatory-like domain-containing protein, partial [Candidatus Sulfotelmatobacter sp.]
MSFLPVGLLRRGGVGLALAMLLVSCCAAQQQPGEKASITGTVTEQKGEPLPGAKVLLDAGANVKLEIECGPDGAFAFNDLFPGTYSISVTAPNFTDKLFPNVVLSAGQNAPLKVSMAASAPQTEQSAAGGRAVGSVASGPSGEKGSITGTVTDPSGALMPRVKVTLAGGTVKLEVVSSATGTYAFKNLPAGTYTLTASAANFAQKVLENIALTAGLELPMDVAMEPASTSEKVNVESSNVGHVETETATVSGTIEEKEVTGLQLNGRNFSQLIALAPGVSNQTGQDEGKVGVVGSVKYSVNGGRVEYNTFEVDGGDVLNTGLNRSASTLVVYPSVDAIQEVKVLTSNYGAQYGRTASGTVQVTT